MLTPEKIDTLGYIATLENVRACTPLLNHDTPRRTTRALYLVTLRSGLEPHFTIINCKVDLVHAPPIAAVDMENYCPPDINDS
jgi:hypothetical protein